MRHPGRTLAFLVVALGPALLPAAALASDGSPAGEGVPPVSQADDGGLDLRSLIPPFLRNLFGGGEPAGSVTGPAATEAADEGGSTVRAEPRPSLVPLVEPLWIDLTPAQQTALAPLAPEWNTWSAAEKRSWVSLANRLAKMSDTQRTTAERRIREWANLTPAQRRLARQNYRLAKERPADQRMTEWHNYQTLTEEQQSVLRRAATSSTTAAGQAGTATGLAKEASQPLPRVEPPAGSYGIFPARGTPGR